MTPAYVTVTLVVRGGNWDNVRSFYLRGALEDVHFGSRIRGADAGFRVVLLGRAKRA